MNDSPPTKTVAPHKPELQKALAYTRRLRQIGSGGTVRVQMFEGSKTRNLTVRERDGDLYVITGKYQKHIQSLSNMHDAVICYLDDKPFVVTYVERP